MPLKGNAETILVYEMKHFSALATQRSKTRCKLICSYHCLDEPIFMPKPTRTEIGINWRIVRMGKSKTGQTFFESSRTLDTRELHI